MSARLDTLDEREGLRGPFLGSLLLHGGLAGLFVVATMTHLLERKVLVLGDPNGGRFGAVAVTPVGSIPLPNRAALPNPVANDTQSQVPQAPPKPKEKPQPKAKALPPDPDAIPLKMRNSRRPVPEQNKWAEKQAYRENQLYSSRGSAVSSPMFQMQGGGGVGLGTDSPLGTQFGWYANLLLTAIGQHWRPSTTDARGETTPAILQFTLLRDGTVAPGSVRVVQTSGSRELDYSAQRALLDISQFPPLPPQLQRDRVDLQVHFDLRH
jgi:periplasmic protein TonB